jgi:excisionase family DNA binding protein
MPEPLPTTDRGLTPREIARLLRVSPERVRTWIARGELGAVTTADHRCGRPRYVVLPHHLAEWERSRAAAQPPPPRRRQKRTSAVDYYPDN